MKPYEVLHRGHEAAMEVRGKDLRALFQNAALGYLSLVERTGRARAEETVTVRVSSAGAEALLVHWLSELVYLTQTKKWLFAKVEFTRLHENNLTAVLEGETMKEGVHAIGREVKAVTFYELKISRDRDALKANVVFDL